MAEVDFSLSTSCCVCGINNPMFSACLFDWTNIFALRETLFHFLDAAKCGGIKLTPHAMIGGKVMSVRLLFLMTAIFLPQNSYEELVKSPTCLATSSEMLAALPLSECVQNHRLFSISVKVWDDFLPLLPQILPGVFERIAWPGSPPPPPCCLHCVMFTKAC